MTNSMSLIEASGSPSSDAAGGLTDGTRSAALTAGELLSTPAGDASSRSHHEQLARDDWSTGDARTSWRSVSLGSAVVLVIVATIALTIVLGWDGLLALFGR